MRARKLSQKFYEENSLSAHKFQAGRKGFSAVEVIVVLGVIGILAALMYPNIMMVLEKRSLENTARDIQTTLERAKIQAIKTRLNHRVRFQQVQNLWTYFIEEQDTGGNWRVIRGFPSRTVSPDIIVAMNFPQVAGTMDNAVIFSPLGIITNYVAGQNSITLTSADLVNAGQPGSRTLMVYTGGSVQYSKQ